MSRDATAAAESASQADIARPVLFAELDYASGFVRLNSTDRSLFFDSNGDLSDEEFLGVGRLGSISATEESSELQASGVKMSLSGIPPEFISAAFENAQGRTAKIWLGFLDGAYRVVADPVLVFSGLIDKSDIALGSEGKVTISVENRLVAWERPKVRRYTNEDQQQLFPGDKAFEFVNPTVEKELLWGVGSTNQVPRAQPRGTPTKVGQGGRGSEGVISGPEGRGGFVRGGEGGP